MNAYGGRRKGAVLMGRQPGGVNDQNSSTIHRSPISEKDVQGPLRKSLAVAIIVIMIVAGFATIGQLVVIDSEGERIPCAPIEATSLPGGREATYTIDHMFELYLKSHDSADLGRWNGTMGINEWWSLREALYMQYQARPEFPYVLVRDPDPWYEPTETQITTWYRLTVDARNVSELAAGPGEDPIFVPILGQTDTAGAYVNISYYGTYLENSELISIRGGTHYANTYYGVPSSVTPRPSTDDGFYHELQGTLTFNRAAAAKFLGLSGSGSLVDQFEMNDDTITSAWSADWMAEGGPGGPYDINTAYDYSLEVNFLELESDPASAPDNLVLRFWSVSWGNEILLVRYLEAAGVQKYWQGWPDDWYLNMTIRPDGGDVHSRAVMGYHMYATRDSLNDINGWALEASHIDRRGSLWPIQTYASPYEPYDPWSTNVTRISTAPLSRNFGKPVSYMVAPMHWNLTLGEKFVVRLPPPSMLLPGYWPKSSTFDVTDNPDAKRAEMAGNATWGQMVAGNGYPNSGSTNLRNFYNPVSRTYTLVGPLNFNKNWNPSFPWVLGTGAPMFVMNVVQSFNLNLVAGWNLVSLPLAGYGYRASTLGLNSGDVVAVLVHTPQYNITYKTYIVGIPLNDFAILPGQGFWIYVTSSKSLTVYGVVPNTPQTINIPSPGWWMIGFLGFKSWHASEIAAMFTGTSLIVEWDKITKTYRTYIAGLPINNFLISPGEGCWIYASDGGVIQYIP